MAAVVTVNDVLDGHEVLDLECLDRIYVNGYVPNLQVGGQVASFLTQHLGNPIPSPAILEKIGTGFRRAVRSFAADNEIPVVQFGKDDRKIDVMRPYLAAQAATGRPGVAAIGVAQEFARVFLATKHTGQTTGVWFSFTKADRRVTCYYFYVWDDDFGPTFVKVCAYFPYPVKIWINGHEWAKRQAAKAGIEFAELSNGFASATDPAALQAICDRFGPATIGVFAERWWSRLPLPLTEHDRAAGYWWELSMRQVEVSRTLVFDAPRRARGFFEALVADNLDIGRPEVIELIFRRGQPRGRPAAGQFKTKIVTYGTEVNVNAFYRHSRIKQYLKDGRALRIETVVNDPGDLGCLRRLHHLNELQSRARAVNRRLLDTERVGQGCVLASPAFERIAQPTLTEDGRGPGLTVRRPSGPSPGRRLVHHLTRRHRHHQQEPARLDGRTARRCELLDEPGQLRPSAASAQRTDHPYPGPQPLPPHQRRPRVRDLLHQSPSPLAAPPARRRRAARSTIDTKRFAHHRHSHHTTNRQRQAGTKSSLKLKTTLKVLATKVARLFCLGRGAWGVGRGADFVLGRGVGYVVSNCSTGVCDGCSRRSGGYRLNGGRGQSEVPPALLTVWGVELGFCCSWGVGY